MRLLPANDKRDVCYKTELLSEQEADCRLPPGYLPRGRRPHTKPFPDLRGRRWEGEEDFSRLNFSMKHAQVTRSRKSYSQRGLGADGAGTAPRQPIAGIAQLCREDAAPALASAEGMPPCALSSQCLFCLQANIFHFVHPKKKNPAGPESALYPDALGLQIFPPPTKFCSQSSALPTTPGGSSHSRRWLCGLLTSLAPRGAWVLGGGTVLCPSPGAQLRSGSKQCPGWTWSSQTSVPATGKGSG